MRIGAGILLCILTYMVVHMIQERNQLIRYLSQHKYLQLEMSYRCLNDAAMKWGQVIESNRMDSTIASHLRECYNLTSQVMDDSYQLAYHTEDYGDNTAADYFLRIAQTMEKLQAEAADFTSLSDNGREIIIELLDLHLQFLAAFETQLGASELGIDASPQSLAASGEWFALLKQINSLISPEDLQHHSDHLYQAVATSS